MSIIDELKTQSQEFKTEQAVHMPQVRLASVDASFGGYYSVSYRGTSRAYASPIKPFLGFLTASRMTEVAVVGGTGTEVMILGDVSSPLNNDGAVARVNATLLSIL
jgi:hypothetical protein